MHLREHVRPGVALELQCLLRAGGVHPVGDEPVLVAVGVARPAGGQDVDQSPGGGQRHADVALPEQVRLVASDQQDLTGNIGGGRSGEREPRRRGRRRCAGARRSAARFRRTSASRLNGIAPGSTLITPARRRITHSRAGGPDVLVRPRPCVRRRDPTAAAGCPRVAAPGADAGCGRRARRCSRPG